MGCYSKDFTIEKWLLWDSLLPSPKPVPVKRCHMMQYNKKILKKRKMIAKITWKSSHFYYLKKKKECKIFFLARSYFVASQLLWSNKKS